MGCTQSKIENEEAVARCKERKHHMKEAVSARNAFAAAHSFYAVYLKNTGAALSDYAQGEVQNPQLPHQVQPNSSSSSAAAAAPAQFVEPLLPPPPPPSNFAPPAPLQRAATMPEIKMPKPDPPLRPKPIMEEDEDEDEDEGSVNLRRRRSSRSGSRGGHREVVEEVQVSNRAPPTVSQENRRIQSSYQQQPDNFSYDFFFHYETPGPTLSEVEEVNISKEEIDRNMFDGRTKRVEEEEEEEEVKSSATKVESEPVPEKAAVAEPPPPPDPAAAGAAAAAAAVAAMSMKKAKPAGPGAVKGNVNLLQIFVELDDHFLKASESAHEVSKMLEATRLHYHSNFADNRGNGIDFFIRVDLKWKKKKIKIGTKI